MTGRQGHGGSNEKSDSTNGFAVHFGSSDVKEEIPELRVEIPKSYMDSIDISASDCSVNNW